VTVAGNHEIGTNQGQPLHVGVCANSIAADTCDKCPPAGSFTQLIWVDVTCFNVCTCAEYQSDGTKFASYSRRYPMAHSVSGRWAALWHTTLIPAQCITCAPVLATVCIPCGLCTCLMRYTDSKAPADGRRQHV
jgi:hypothetical protein